LCLYKKTVEKKRKIELATTSEKAFVVAINPLHLYSTPLQVPIEQVVLSQIVAADTVQMILTCPGLPAHRPQ
jgi:hypothetical protein